jgi:hypothetical protein
VRQRQLEQFLLEQVLQPDRVPPSEEPELRWAKALKSLATLPLPQLGHLIVWSEDLERSSSKAPPHSAHRYSYIGIEENILRKRRKKKGVPRHE